MGTDAIGSIAIISGGVVANEQSDIELLLPREVAALLRVKVSTVYAAAGAGRLPTVTLWRGRRKSLLRFRRADIEALISGRTIELPQTATQEGRPKR
jgi:excisionase family DNA binding protein